jgi:deoxyadenosine/deoxycytidine kinase
MKFFFPMTTNRHDDLPLFEIEISRVLECLRKKQAEQQQLDNARASLLVAVMAKLDEIFERQDKRLREFEERQDKLFNKLFLEAEHLAMNGKETLDETMAVHLAIDSIEFEELHPIPEKVENLEQFKT